MTEAEWLGCDELRKMLKQLRGEGSDRKFMLFGFSCCQDIRPYLDPRSSAALDTAGRYADGLRSRSTLNRARAAAIQALRESGQGNRCGAMVVAWLCHKGVKWHCEVIARESADYLASHQTRPLRKAARRLARQQRVRLLRDIFGNPFRRVAWDPAWLAWNGGTVPTLARAVYEERELPGGQLDPVRLALLADMMEDAGCTEPQVLEHLRGPGPHVRGCWVVDLLLGLN